MNRLMPVQYVKQAFAVDNAAFRAALTSGDDLMLNDLINRVNPDVKKYLTALGAQTNEAEEIFFISLEALWERGRRRAFEPDFKFFPFLLEIAKHTWYNHLRRKKNTVEGLTEEVLGLLSTEPDVHDLVAAVELRTRILRYLNQLGDPCKTLLIRWSEGAPFEEIADELGYANVESVRQQKFKCLKRLRKISNHLLNDLR